MLIPNEESPIDLDTYIANRHNDMEGGEKERENDFILCVMQ
jgi:hypothetical protein